MSSSIFDRVARSTVARITGGVYLTYILTMILADVLGHIGRGTVEQVYRAILADPFSFRTGLVVNLFSAMLFLLVAWGLYVLLRPIDRDLALLFLALNAVGVAIHCVSSFPLISALLQGDAASGMHAFSAAQLEGLARLSIGTYKTGFVAAQLFFSAWLFPLGYLVYRSKFLPRFLGVLLMLDGVGCLIWFLQGMLAPALKSISVPGLAVSFLAEVGLAIWLLARGVKNTATSMEASV